MITIFIHKELNSTRTSVVDSACDLERILADRLSLFISDAQSRCELNYLLVSSLYGTVSLIEMYNIAVLVAEDLHFDVLWLLDVFLDKYIAVSECLDSLVLSAVELRQQVLFLTDDPHSSSAAACSSLEHYRVTCRIRELDRIIVIADGSLNTRDARYAYLVSDHFGLDLITETVHHLVCRSAKSAFSDRNP